MEIVKLTIEEYDDFINQANNTSLYQTTEYGLTMQNQGYEVLFIGMKNNNKIIAGTLILIKKRLGWKYGYCPRGFIIDYQDLELINIWTLKLKKFLQSYNIIAIKLCPPIKKDDSNYQQIFGHLKKLGYYHFGFNDFFEALKPRYEALIDLRPTLDNIFAEIKKDFRTKIRSAHNQGIKIIKGDVEDLVVLHNQTKRKYHRDIKYFSDLYSHFEKTNNIAVYCAHFDTQYYLEKIKSEYERIEKESDNINRLVMESSNKTHLIDQKIIIDQKFSDLKNRLIEATNISRYHPNGLNLASALVVTHKDEVYMLMDGLNEKYKSFNAKHLLIWRLIENYKQMGYKKLNLGGMINPEIKESKYIGLNLFKTNFNAKVIEYVGDFELTINRSKYFIFSKANPISNILKR